MFSRTLLQYVAIAAPVFVPAAAAAPQTCDRWKPTYPDKVYATPRTVDYANGPRVPIFVPDVTIHPLTWKGTSHPDRVIRLRLPIAVQPAYQAPPFQPPPLFSPGGQIIATGSIKHLLQYQSLTGPFEETAAPAPADTAIIGRFAERTWRRRAVVHQQAWAFDTQWGAPAAATAPELVPPVLTVPTRRTYPRATYVQTQPIFAFVVPVPVMSWTGLYLDPPPRRRVRHQPIISPFPLDYDTTINPPSPVLGWEPKYPSRPSRHRPRQQGQFTVPLFVPDLTVQVPALSWHGRYADRVPARRALRTGQHPAFFFDRFTAPDEVVAPDLAAPVYVDRVYGRRPLTRHPAYLAPEFVADVTQPVAGMEWLAVYPDRIDRETLPTMCKLSWTGVVFIAEFIPAPVIHEIDGRGSYHRKLFGRASGATTIYGRGSL